ncbi:hypothetical protein F4778DRAFT_504360 [Xylariomycetidae sp. FL2044]|nr:hypothetical protein F4778DRAFT_504360 [Xylariomycetidae sp. FL2044]
MPTTTTTTTPTSPSPSPLRTALETQGYVIIRSLLSPEALAPLQAAARQTADLARSGQWPYVRTHGKQFPPWETPSPSGPGQRINIWGVQSLLHPDLAPHVNDDAFASLYFGDAVLGLVKEILAGGDDENEGGDEVKEVKDEDLVMELLNMLVAPDTDFELRWHRDDIPAEATAEEEEVALGLVDLVPPDEKENEKRKGKMEKRKRYWHTQYNIALHDADTSLVVIPGSHARARTEAERDPKNAFADTLPGMRTVRLDAGDAVFYDNNIVHRGVYKGRVSSSGGGERERLSLHGSVGHVGGGGSRARNVLQHGVGEWVGRCDFSGLGLGLDGEDGKGEGEGEEEEEKKKRIERVRKRAEGMRDRLVKLGERSGEVGYSLEG